MDKGVGEKLEVVITPPEELAVASPLEVEVGMKQGDKVGAGVDNGNGVASQSSTAFPTEVSVSLLLTIAVAAVAVGKTACSYIYLLLKGALRFVGAGRVF